MARIKPGSNPFYQLLVVAGVLFLITACAYFVMTFQASRAPVAGDEPRHPLLSLMERHGAALMLGELGVLALATFLAMATDRYWIRRAAARRHREADASNAKSPGDRAD